MILIRCAYLPIEKLTAVVAGFLPVGSAGVAGATMLLFVSGHEVQDDQYDDYWAHIHLLLESCSVTNFNINIGSKYLPSVHLHEI